MQGIGVTSPPRTLLDTAPRMPAKSLTRRVNEARRGNLLTPGEVADVIDRFRYRQGATLLKPHADTTQNATRSAFEDDRERDATMLLHGIATVRVTKRRLRRDPDREAGRLTQIIAARRPYGAVASRPNLSRSRR